MEALLRGSFQDLFRYNILFLPLGVPCMCILLHEYLRIVFPGLSLKPVRIPQRLMYGITSVIVLFWIARNIPAFSFLAPAA